jgi:tetratricopeptide (TPR) repeat protein
MSRKTQKIVFAAAAIAVIFAFTGCQDISYSKLSANYHFGKANSFFRESQYRRAITEYEATLKYNPNMTQAYHFLGESYKQLYKPGVDSALNKEFEAKTLAALRKALEIEPNNKDIIYSLGDMYDKLRNFPEAEKLYLRIVDLEPDNMSNYYVLADFFKRYIGMQPGMDKKAESMYLRRIETDPDNPQGYAYAANYYENLPASAENIDQAIANYDKANEFWDKRIALEPTNAEAWLSKGVNRWNRAYRFQTRPGVSPDRMKQERLRVAMDAKAAIEKAIEIDPTYPEPYSHMSPLYKAVFAALEPEKAARYNAEADQYIEKFQELRKRAAERKKLEEELKK